ncbi:MAG: hypothetical protein ACPHF4_06060, partial [Rubripirellula sp.]
MLNKSLNEVREIIAGAISAPNNINTQQDSGSVQKMRRESHRKIAAPTLPTTRVTIRPTQGRPTWGQRGTLGGGTEAKREMHRWQLSASNRAEPEF